MDNEKIAQAINDVYKLQSRPVQLIMAMNKRQIVLLTCYCKLHNLQPTKKNLNKLWEKYSFDVSIKASKLNKILDTQDIFMVVKLVIEKLGDWLCVTKRIYRHV